MTTTENPEPAGWVPDTLPEWLTGQTTVAPEPAPAPAAITVSVEEQPATVPTISRARIGLIVGALLVTVVVAGAGFSISASMLDSAGQAAGISESVSWLMAVAIDGPMLAATIVWQVRALLRAGGTRYPASVVILGCLVSMGAAGMHAAAERDPGVPVWAAVPIAALPALMLAFTVHLATDLAHLFAPADERSPAESEQVKAAVSAHKKNASVSAVVSGERSLNERCDEPVVSAPASVQAVTYERSSEQRTSAPVSVERAGERSQAKRAVSAKASADGAVPTDARKWIAAQLRAGKALTGTQVGERYGKSPATGRRWLADVTAELNPTSKEN